MGKFKSGQMTYSEGISNLLNSALEHDQNKPAVILNDQSYSYGTLDNDAQALAANFQDSNLSGERVAFMLPNGVDIIITYLACFKSGAIAMPLNRRYAAPEFYRALLNAEPRWLIIEPDRLDLLSNTELAKTNIEKIFVVGNQSATNYMDFNTLLAGAKPFTPTQRSPSEPALIFFTSGSTGQPKGVVHTCKSVRAMLESTADALQSLKDDDVILVCDPQVHISGFIETFSVLMNGGSVVLHDGFEIDRYLVSLEQRRPTLIITHIDILMKLLDSGRCTKDTLSSVRGVYTGGDELPSTLQKRFLELTGKPIQLGYGMTEAIWLTICREAVFDRGKCIGKPVSGVELRIVDRDGKDLPPGESGEILVRGPMVMSHYWNNEQETEDSFIDGWFRTGDCAMRDDRGTYWYTGRIKNIIIRNTSNIYPGEVEEALYKHHKTRGQIFC